MTDPKGAEHERMSEAEAFKAWLVQFCGEYAIPGTTYGESAMRSAFGGGAAWLQYDSRLAGAPTPEKMTTEEAERAYAEAKPVPLPPEFVDRLIARLNDWCVTYGKSLCPPGADTFGEGMREAKKQVAHILASKRTGKAQEWSTPKDAGSRPEAPSSEGSASCANPFDADEILNRIRATAWDAEHDRETFAMSREAARELLSRLGASGKAVDEVIRLTNERRKMAEDLQEAGIDLAGGLVVKLAQLLDERTAALSSLKSAEEEAGRLRKMLVETREVLDRTGARILQAATDDDMAHDLLDRAQQDVTAAERRIDSALKEPHAQS